MVYRHWRVQTVLWCVGNALLFATWAVVRQVSEPMVGHVYTGSAVVAALTALVYLLLLRWPVHQWVRVAAVALPCLAGGLRAVGLLLDQPVHWLGVVFAVLLAFIYMVAGPVMLPPPVTNGHARQLLDGPHG